MVIQIIQRNNGPNEDQFSKLVGQFGKWQFVVFASVFLVKLSSGWVQMSVLFLTPNLTFRCVEFASNSTIATNSTCYSDCLKYEYDTKPFENTIVSEWNLICDKQWLASFTQMVLQFGVLMGSSIFGFFSDRYGRKVTFLVSVTFLIVFGFAAPFSPDYITFTVLRFFIGFAAAGTMVISFVIVMETIGPKYREFFGCIFHIPFILGHITLPAFAYFYRSWDKYLLAMAVPQLIYIGYFFLLSESPRWLISVGKEKEAASLIKKAAIMNNLPCDKIEETVAKMSQEIASRSQEVKHSYIDLFGSKLLLRTATCCLLWFTVGLTFFGFNQYISQISSDPFITVASAGAIQIPSNFFSIWLLSYYGRRLATALCFSFAGLCVITLGCVTHTFWMTLALGTLGVSFTAIVATMLYVFTLELYPTVVRNMGMGVCSTTMRIGSMIAPFVLNLSVILPWSPYLIFGLAPIVAGLICLLLPETIGQSLPDSLEDINT